MVIGDWRNLSCRINLFAEFLNGAEPCWNLVMDKLVSPPQVPLPSSLAKSSTYRQKSHFRIGKALNLLYE
jgi:hypothetical protein